MGTCLRYIVLCLIVQLLIFSCEESGIPYLEEPPDMKQWI